MVVPVSRIGTPSSSAVIPEAITPEPSEPNALRYADGRVFAGGRLIVCVRESHGEGEPVNELVVLPTDGSAEPRVVATGGLAPLIATASEFIDEVDLTLTLDGLRLVYEMNRGRAPE